MDMIKLAEDILIKPYKIMEAEKMKFQPRIIGVKLTKEQQDIEDWTFEAQQILKEHGYDCIVDKLIVTSPKDYPANIKVIGKV